MTKNILYIFVLIFIISGCISREITVNSVPSGASCEINGRVIGETPVKFKFIENRKFRLFLKLKNYQELHTGFKVKKKWQDYFVLDFFAELIPYKMVNSNSVEFVLVPIKKMTHEEFLKEVPQKIHSLKSNE